MAVACAFSMKAWAQPVDEARKSAEKAAEAEAAARESAAEAKASEQSALRYMKEAQKAQVQTQEAAEAAKPHAPANEEAATEKTVAAEPTSVFDKLQFLGNANLIGGSLATEDGKTLASGGVGVYAATKRWSFVASFTFGSQGTSEEDANTADYINFLRSPSSAVGGQVQVRFLKPYGKVIRLGGSLTTRVNAIDFAFGEEREESIKLLALDPSIAISLLFSDTHEISFLGEVGLGLRFWNKPSQPFRDALGLPDDSHSYAGVRVLGALAISNLYVGVEVTRYGGGDLAALKEFAIIPYVGLRGGLDIFDKDKPPTTTPATDAKAVVAPPATPLM